MDAEFFRNLPRSIRVGNFDRDVGDRLIRGGDDRDADALYAEVRQANDTFLGSVLMLLAINGLQAWTRARQGR